MSGQKFLLHPENSQTIETQNAGKKFLDRVPTKGEISFLEALLTESKLGSSGISSYSLRKNYSLAAGTVMLWMDRLLALKYLDVKKGEQRNKILISLTYEGIQHAESRVEYYKSERGLLDKQYVFN